MASLGGRVDAGARAAVVGRGRSHVVAGSAAARRQARDGCRTLRIACALRSVVASMISSTLAVRAAVDARPGPRSATASSSGARRRSSASSGSGSVSSSSRLRQREGADVDRGSQPDRHRRLAEPAGVRAQRRHDRGEPTWRRGRRRALGRRRGRRSVRQPGSRSAPSDRLEARRVSGCPPPPPRRSARARSTWSSRATTGTRPSASRVQRAQDVARRHRGGDPVRNDQRRRRTASG